MSFLNPNVLFLLIPLFVLILLILTNKSNMEKYFNKDVLEKLTVSNNGISKSTRNGLMFFTLILFIVALARPVIDKKEQTIDQEVIPLVVALDVSLSMKAKDIYPNRVELAKKKLQAIIKKANNMAIGVVLFAKDSFILSPVTHDFISLEYIVNNIDTSLEFTNGSNFFSVLEATNNLLNDYKNKNLIILTDGGNDADYADHVEFAKQYNIATYIIAIASKKGSAIPKPNGNGYITDENGKIVTVGLNDSIKKLALNSNGGYIEYSNDFSDVEQIINKITFDSNKDQLNQEKIKIYHELFYYPLALAIFVLLFAFSSFPRLKSSINIFIVLIGFSYSNELYGFDFKHIESAKKYYENQQYDQAANEYRKLNLSAEVQYNLANSLYKQQQYEEAMKLYGDINTDDLKLKSKILHNMGNSAVKQNDLLKAKEYYEKSLNILQDDQTKENLEMVKKALEKQQKKENQNKDQQEDKEDSKNKKEDNNNNENSEEQKKQNQNEENQSEENENQQDKSKQNKDAQENNESKQHTDSNQSVMQNDNNNSVLNEQMSDLEEKKWMEMLQNKKTPIFLQKVESSKGDSNDVQPW